MKVPKKNTADMSKFPKLPEMQPLLVQIEKPGSEDKPNPEYLDETYKGEPRKKVRFRMRVAEGPYAGDGTDDNPPGKLWGSHGFTLGKRKTGEPAMLRQLVVAARPDLIQGKSEKEAEETLHDFDLDELQGEFLIVIGRYDPSEPQEDQSYLTPIAYSSAPPDTKRRLAGQAPAAAAPAANGTGSDGFQYQVFNDVQHRWKEGMAGWEPVPVSAPAAPPPPPVAAAPPPPPAPPASPFPAGPAAAPAAIPAGNRADF